MSTEAVHHPRPHDLLLLLALVGVAACGTDPPGRSAPSEELVVDRTTADGVTVVRNLAGSAWGGTARLEEELSIGTAEGDENTMFGDPAGFWLTDDEIFVLDAQDASVRVFDRRGRFLRRFGSAGQGPGETEFPNQILVTDDDRVLINGQAKVAVYSIAGEHLEDWSLGTAAAQRLVSTPQGLFARVSLRPTDPLEAIGRAPTGFRRIGPRGISGEARAVPDLGAEPRRLTVELGGASYPFTVPLTLPGPLSALAPTGDLVYGYPVDRYRFYVQRPGGETMAVERDVEPVRIADGEREEARFLLLALLRQRDPSFAWDGDEIPAVRPYYVGLIPDHSGRVWVSRQGPSLPVPDCDPPERRRGMRSYRSCWEPERLLEVYSLDDGRYLGPVMRPANTGLGSSPFVRGEHLVAATEDEAGTPLVTLYRVRLPSAAGRGDP